MLLRIIIICVYIDTCMYVYAKQWATKTFTPQLKVARGQCANYAKNSMFVADAVSADSLPVTVWTKLCWMSNTVAQPLSLWVGCVQHCTQQEMQPPTLLTCYNHQPQASKSSSFIPPVCDAAVGGVTCVQCNLYLITINSIQPFNSDN